VDVIDAGVVPTPLNYWALHHLPVVGGIQITGSHNPPSTNGFKLSRGSASMHGDEIQRLYAMTQSPSPPRRRRGTYAKKRSSIATSTTSCNASADFRARFARVYDCGNGAGALVAPRCSRALASGRGLFCESDGTFPEPSPDPTVPENLEDLIAAVPRTARRSASPSTATPTASVSWTLRRDRVGRSHSHSLRPRRARAHRTRTADHLRREMLTALPTAVEQAGGKPVMWKTGHSLIKDKMREMHAPIAGEMSGHMFFSEGFYGHDDALYGARALLRILAIPAHCRQAAGRRAAFVSTPELRIDVPKSSNSDLVEKR
jgi:phosphomannomutase/phosphoglucomutase